MASRALTAAVGLVASLGISLVLWLAFGFPFVFLVVPFVPLVLGRDGGESPPVRTCPACGYQTQRSDHEYCPRDGRRLER